MYLFLGIMFLLEIFFNLLKKVYGMFIVLKIIRKIMRGILFLLLFYECFVVCFFFVGKIVVL